MLTELEDCKIVLGVDIGTTNIRCYAYNRETNIVGKAFEKLHVENLENGGQEIKPEVLWEAFQNVVKRCLQSAQLNAKDVTSLGISTLRGTFVTWNCETGELFHNFLTWKDKRAEKLCDQWNSLVKVKVLRFVTSILYFITRKRIFQVVSSLQFSSAMVIMRLIWVFKNIIKLKKEQQYNKIYFGTIDTWLLWKLTKGRIHATEPSNACITGFFDAFQTKWSSFMLKLCDIPPIVLPTIKNTCDSYGDADPEIFGASIPICAVVGDQQASLFGAGCFEKNDIKCTMGTGSFINMNTGNTPLGVYNGFYPLVGWVISSEPTYIIEGAFHDVGTVISWTKKMGLIDEPENSSKIAASVPDNGSIYFVSGASMLEKKTSEQCEKFAFVGLKVSTSKEHLVRSVLEALAFQVCDLYQIAHNTYGTSKNALFRICGGISKNDFILQLISNVTERNIYRLDNIESSSLGAALLAGLHSGVWKNLNEIKLIIKATEKISPNLSLIKRNQKEFIHWKSLCLSYDTVWKQMENILIQNNKLLPDSNLNKKNK